MNQKKIFTKLCKLNLGDHVTKPFEKDALIKQIHDVPNT